MTTITALPKVTVNRWGIGERALGRLLKLDLSKPPADVPQSDLVGDTFFQLWKSDPQMQVTIPTERAVNAALLQWVRDTPNWQGTKNYTAGNLPAAMSSSGILWQMLTADKTLQAALKKQAEAAQAQEQAEQEQLKADALLQAAQDTANTPKKRERMVKRAQKAQKKSDDLEQKANAIAQQAQQVVDKAKQDKMVETTVSSAVGEARDKAQETAEQIAGWGFDPGSDVHKDASAAQEFMRRMSTRLAAIAKMAGRMRGVALSARRARIATGTTIAEVQPTRDLLNVFPGELAFLSPNAPAELRAIQASKLTSAGLLGWKLGGDAQERGPFVGFVDVSGSMGSRDAWNGQEREAVGKGILLGIAQTAKAEARSYILGTFGSDSDPTYLCQSSADWKAHLDWAERSRGGGTSFDKALTATMEQLTALGQTAKGADAVIVSDGEALVSKEVADKWRAFAKETGARLLYVPTPQDYCAENEQSLSKLADKVVMLESLDKQHGESATSAIAQWLR